MMTRELWTVAELSAILRALAAVSPQDDPAYLTGYRQALVAVGLAIGLQLPAPRRAPIDMLSAPGWFG